MTMIQPAAETQPLPRTKADAVVALRRMVEFAKAKAEECDEVDDEAGAAKHRKAARAMTHLADSVRDGSWPSAKIWETIDKIGAIEEFKAAQSANSTPRAASTPTPEPSAWRPRLSPPPVAISSDPKIQAENEWKANANGEHRDFLNQQVFVAWRVSELSGLASVISGRVSHA